MNASIAIVGLACEFPGSSSPEELWRTSLLGQRWFRTMPPERLGSAYFDTLGEVPDTTSVRRAALIEGYSIPAQEFKLGENDVRSADFVHWLALDCANRAISDSGLGDLLPRQSTRVIVGNSLTGESSRAELLRLRWPYVRKSLEESGCTGTEADWSRRERQFKARLTPIDGRTLAGSLSNVIAGRIANHFDLQGGCYCVDAACASSLVAVAQACSQLATGEIDCCLVGGVDVSMDPLELVGFSVAGALCRGDMKIFDQNRSGFLPGEGCGFAVLMRSDHPALASCRVRALVRGWAVSSDGRHDLTAPSPRGQRAALQRAYMMAGYGLDSVPLIEAHGTGTLIGDEVELGTLAALLNEDAPGNSPALAVGSIKANIGHTKAAAGMAGLIKTVMALEHRILPPTTGCDDPMPVLKSLSSRVRVLASPEPWPDKSGLRAGVSGFGFGGVNAHITLESPEQSVATSSTTSAIPYQPRQDVELFVFDGHDSTDLRNRVEKLQSVASYLADAEFPSAAATTARTLKSRPFRAAIIASNSEDLQRQLNQLLVELDSDSTSTRRQGNIFLGWGRRSPRLGFLFPGQGSRAKNCRAAIWSRFQRLLNGVELPGATSTQSSGASVLQSNLVASSTATAWLLQKFAIEPSVCIGHSLGEISALQAAGALSQSAAVQLAHDRGRLMEEAPGTEGRMLALSIAAEDALRLVNGHPLSIAAFNAPDQTVFAGESKTVALVAKDARQQKVRAVVLETEFAFHSTQMRSVSSSFAARLKQTEFRIPRTPVHSTVTGKSLGAESDLRALLVSQLTDPVRFSDAFASAKAHADLWLELGPGRTLLGLVGTENGIATETDADTLHPFLSTLACCFVHGANPDLTLLYSDRHLPNFDLDSKPRFFTNPCERPLPNGFHDRANPVPLVDRKPHVTESSPPPPGEKPNLRRGGDPLEVVLREIATRKGAGISASQIRPQDTLGPDLGVDSLGLMELTATVERALDRRASTHPLKSMAVAEFAALFEEHSGSSNPEPTLSDLLVPWVRVFDVVWDQSSPLEEALAKPSACSTHWSLVSTSRSSLPAPFLAGLSRYPSALLVHCSAEVATPFLEELLSALRGHPADETIVFLDSTGQLPGFAKTLAIEQPARKILFLHFEEVAIPAPEIITSEMAEDFTFREVRYDAAGSRYLPRCTASPEPSTETEFPLSSEDVILVTGGAKGITAECMVALAGHTGAKFVIVGTSSNDAPAVQQTLRKLTEMGIQNRYRSVDISDEAAIERLVADIPLHLGSITAVIHGAGIHAPHPIAKLTAKVIDDHCHAKVHGLKNLLSYLPAASLKLVVAFGSVIARSGYERSGAYALANDCLARLIADYQCHNPHLCCLTLDWSAWAETGMGVDLQAIAPLRAAGVDPIRTEDGVSAFLQILRDSAHPRPIIAGRLPQFPTVSFRKPGPVLPLPGCETVSFTPGVEWVINVPISLKAYPWLAGHALDGNVILPGVLALEIMDQSCAALHRASGLPPEQHTTRNVRFTRPITIPSSGQVSLCIQAVRTPDGSIECRLSEAEHPLTSPAVSAQMVTSADAHECPVIPLPPATLAESEGVALKRDLYNQLLFHRDPFAHIQRYSHATAHEVVFHLPDEPTTLDPFQHRILTKDAFIHGLQACVPGELLLPAGIGTIIRSDSTEPATTIRAQETCASDGAFTYNLTAISNSGQVVEEWTELVLHRYRHATPSLTLHPKLQEIHRQRSGPPTESATNRRYFEYRHTVGLKETNLVGNVYFSNYLEWQGRCREMFLHRHAPEVLKEIQAGTLALVTVSCSCDYLAELQAFDELSIRMTLEAHGHDWASMRFDYWRMAPDTPILIASGLQRIASRFRGPKGLAETPLPDSLLSALQPFA